MRIFDKFILFFLIIICSCGTSRIIKEREVTITDTIFIHDTIVTPADSGSFQHHMDSLTKSLRDIYNDSLITISAHLDSGNTGMIIYKYKIKERMVPYEKKVPYVKTVKIPCPELKPHEHKWWELLFFGLGIFFSVISVIGVIVWVRKH